MAERAVQLALAAPSAPPVDIAICLLDIDNESPRERLRQRVDPEELLAHHVAFADIDVSPKTRDEANQAVLQWVTDARAGSAPVFRRTWTS